MCINEWIFYDFSGEKSTVIIVDLVSYNTGDGKTNNGKNYRVAGKITGTIGNKTAILLAIEI